MSGLKGRSVDRKTRDKALQPKYVPQLDSTNAESYYYVKQIAGKTPLVVKLKDGEEILGNLQWYDASCITVCQIDGRFLLIPKHVIRTICKQAPEGG